MAGEVFAQNENRPVDLTIEGSIVCAGDQGATIPSPGPCAAPARYALRTDEGKLYFFVDQDPRAEIFKDDRVRAKRLRISGWARPGNRIEIIKLQAVRDGVLYDLYYFCETCNITAYAGGPCPCCREELEFRETRAKKERMKDERKDEG